MKQYIEDLITDALTTIYEQKGVIEPIIIKPDVEWNEETKTLTLTVISNGEVRITVE